MHAENGVHIIQATLFHIMTGFGADFFPHLEQQFHLAWKGIPVGAEDFGRSQEHGRMAVVPAGMHDPGILGSIGFGQIRLLDGQGIDVRPEHQCLSRPLGPLDGADAAGDVRESLDRDPHSFQFRRNVGGGVFFFPPQFRMGMEPVPLFQDVRFFVSRQGLYVHQQAPPSGSRAISLRQSKVSAVRRASFFSLSAMSMSSSSS